MSVHSGTSSKYMSE
jgi:hypothetical protein